MWNQLTIPADRTSAEFHTKSYKLEALAPSTVYEVIVQARNQYGPSDDSKILRFATPSEGKLKKMFLSVFFVSRNSPWIIPESTSYHVNHEQKKARRVTDKRAEGGNEKFNFQF